MDFELSEEQQAVSDLAGQIFAGHLDQERFMAVEATEDHFDRDLWAELARAGLIGISLPSALGGGDQDFLASSVLFEQAGRYAAPLPLLPTVITAMALATFGGDAHAALVKGACAGEVILSFALVESDATIAREDAGVWKLSGSKTCVPAGPIADRILVPAGGGVYLVDPSSPGVTVTRLATTSGSAEARIDLADAPGEPIGGAQIVEWITERATSAICSILAGACKEAVRLTAEYAKTREQFERPIATFQAVAQRAADAYIDAEAVHLTARQAAWRLSQGLAATEEVAIAKYFAAESGQRVVHAAQHIHGGVGVDRSYPLHRYFLLAKQLELTLGGTTANLLKIGAILASEPAAV